MAIRKYLKHVVFWFCYIRLYSRKALETYCSSNVTKATTTYCYSVVMGIKFFIYLLINEYECSSSNVLGYSHKNRIITAFLADPSTYIHISHIEGWAQDWRKSDGCFSPNLISSPWRHYEDYNISFCKQWKFRCHCSYEQWHLNLHCLQRGPSCP